MKRITIQGDLDDISLSVLKQAIVKTFNVIKTRKVEGKNYNLDIRVGRVHTVTTITKKNHTKEK